MQIFSPETDFTKIAKCLDGKRLNKQKVELYQILKTIQLGNMANGWRNHPAVKMARNYELFFTDYGLIIANECLNRGYKDTLIPKITELRELFKEQSEYKTPFYWGDSRFHLSHQSNLVRKNPAYYSQFWSVQPDLEYYWPVQNNI